MRTLIDPQVQVQAQGYDVSIYVNPPNTVNYALSLSSNVIARNGVLSPCLGVNQGHVTRFHVDRASRSKSDLIITCRRRSRMKGARRL